MSAFLSVLAFAFFAVFNPAFAERTIGCKQNENHENIFTPSLLYANAEFYEGLFMKFLDEQDKHIIVLTQEINAQNNLIDLTSLRLFNERGIIYFFTGQLENAVNDFNHVIENLTAHLPLEKKMLGTALWGRMLCHAFSSQLNNTCNDSSLISSLFDKCICHENREKNLFILADCNDHLMILPIAKFAYPEEKISEWECHDRTNRIASKMRSLAEHIPLYVVRQAVLWTIDRQSQKAHKCCENGNHWTECLGPNSRCLEKIREYVG